MLRYLIKFRTWPVPIFRTVVRQKFQVKQVEIKTAGYSCPFYFFIFVPAYGMEKFDETTTPELSTGGGFRLSKPLGGCLWDPIKATLIKRLQ